MIGPIAQLYFGNILLTGPGHLQLLIKTLGAIAIIFQAPEIAEPGRMSMPTGLAALAALLYSHEYGPHKFTSCMKNDGLPMSLEDYLGVILDVVYSDYLQAHCDASLSSSSSTGSTHYEGVVTAGSPARVDDEAASEHEHPSSKNNEEAWQDLMPRRPVARAFYRPAGLWRRSSFDAHVLGTISTRARLTLRASHFGASLCLASSAPCETPPPRARRRHPRARVLPAGLSRRPPRTGRPARSRSTPAPRPAAAALPAIPAGPGAQPVGTPPHLATVTRAHVSGRHGSSSSGRCE